jgi:adenylate kinase family enzyme
MLDSALRFYARNNYHVVSLDISNDTAIERMEERARTDDTRKNMKSRLEWYDSDVIPALEAFDENKGAQVHRIDGERSIEEIHKDIISVLELE